ncbi:Ctr copper transporter family [Rhizoctonia solani]|uniref:Copper transport protein n=1 Tax=Rhizoctonia solani TaxID=456999 RepID=A0A8H7INA4_9AGAM|nr:Ctr copper transporter family [Rhizoctonia solani]
MHNVPSCEASQGTHSFGITSEPTTDSISWSIDQTRHSLFHHPSSDECYYVALALLSIIPSYTLAQHVHGGNADGMGGVAMIPYLHFTPGDALFFKEWIPKSSGAVGGACVGLFVLAILQRCISAMRGVMEQHWKQRSDALVAARFVLMRDTASADKESEQDTSLTGQPRVPRALKPTLPPFIWSHELARGGMQILQSFFGYALMLAVMSFNASFIISVLLGLGVGEYKQAIPQPTTPELCGQTKSNCAGIPPEERFISKMMMTRVFAMAAMAASAAAHFTLEWPRTRGFDEDIENQFCGGFPNAGPRSSFPLGASGVVIDSTHDTANVIVLVSFDANPQNITQFSNSSNGAQLTSFVKLEKQGEACIPVNIQSLGLSNVSNGTNATIQIQYDGGDGNYVTLLSDFTAPSNVSCASSASGTTTSGGAAATSTSPSGSNGALTTQASAGLALGVADFWQCSFNSIVST